jgi:hypothetical protein
VQQQNSENQLENYADILSNDDIYQMLMSQQEQLQDIGAVLRVIMSQQEQLQDISAVLRFIVENMQQKGNLSPDYRPVLMQMEKKLADSVQQQQIVQSTVEKQSKNFQVVDKLTNSVQGMSQKLENQSTSLQQFSNWKDIWQIAFIGVIAGILLLFGTHFLSTLGDVKIEEKLDQLSSQNEKILKKVKR